MRIAVLGTGAVGRTLAGRFDEFGHEVRLGTRDPDRTRRGEGSAAGDLAAWLAERPRVRLLALPDAAADAEVVVLAVSGQHAAATLEQADGAGAGRLAGTVVLDLTNPLDFSAGMPPRLFVCNEDSLAERLQRAFPDVRLVKSLNTVNASLMADPAALGADSTVFVSGDDAEAKALVVDLLRELGHADILDLGGLETARGTEMWLPLWLRVMGALGTARFNLKIVR